MTTEDMFLIIRLLSAMESAMESADVSISDRLQLSICEAMNALEHAIVNQETK
jgi:hypothetical protein